MQITMREIRAKNYNIFPEDAPKDLVSLQTSSLKYIDHLANLTRIDASDLEPLTMFVNKEGKLPRERNKINELFFQWAETQKNKPKSEITNLSDKELEKICFNFDKIFRNQLDKIISDTKDQAKDYEHRRQRALKELEERERQLSIADALLRAFEEKKQNGSGLAGDIQVVMQKGFFTFSDHPAKDAISFLTPEITLSYFKKESAIENIVQMGRFQVDLIAQGANLTAKVRKYDNNLNSNGYYHPHVAQNGDVCYGNMANVASKARSQFNLIELLNIIQAVLTNYHDGNPYQHLYKFEEAAKMGHRFSRDGQGKTEQEIRSFFASFRFTPPLPAPAQAVIQPEEHYEENEDQDFDDDDDQAESTEGYF